MINYLLGLFTPFILVAILYLHGVWEDYKEDKEPRHGDR